MEAHMLHVCFISSTISVAIDAMKQFFQATDSEHILECLESNNVWPLMEKEDTCPHAMLHLARCILCLLYTVCVYICKSEMDCVVCI